jgi:hypothetical protein
MRIRRTAIVLMMTLLAVPALAGPAFAGGRVESDPLPGWLGIAIVVALLVVGAFYVSVVAFGIAYRRRHQ